jgi:hypothetical protein
MAPGAPRHDGAVGALLYQRLGDLGSCAVAGAEEEESRPTSRCPRSDGIALCRRHQRETGMQRESSMAEEISTAKEIGPVIDVAPISRAPPGADDTGLSKLCQMVRDEVLWLSDELDEFTDSAIAAAELADQLPPQGLAEQSQDLGCLFRWHMETISNQIDGMQPNGI